MCKIFVTTKTDRIQKLAKATETIARHLLEVEQDGFGYAVQGSRGAFGERTTRETFESRFEREHLVIKAPIFEETANTFGLFSKPFGAGIFHGRTSTNHKTLVNTHPMRRNEWTLIHNGVVTNHGPTYAKDTTNDSEDVVHFLSTDGIGAIEKHLSGYYAFAALDPKGRLHVGKDATARLFVANCETLGSLIFCTTEELMRDICKALKWKIGPVERVKDNIYLIFDVDGNLVEQTEIKPRGVSYRESRHSSLSLGYEMKTISNYAETYEDTYQPASRYAVEEDKYYDFLAECSRVDESYEIYDLYMAPMSLAQFKRLDDIAKAECIIYRPDGSLMSAYTKAG
jgi:hypothetical protein